MDAIHFLRENNYHLEDLTWKKRKTETPGFIVCGSCILCVEVYAIDCVPSDIKVRVLKFHFTVFILK